MIAERINRDVISEMNNDGHSGYGGFGYIVFAEGEDDWNDILAFLKKYYPDKSDGDVGE